MARYFCIPKAVSIEKTCIEGLPAAWVRPVGADSVLYLHAGGYVTGSVDLYLRQAVTEFLFSVRLCWDDFFKAWG